MVGRLVGWSVGRSGVGWLVDRWVVGGWVFGL